MVRYIIILFILFFASCSNLTLERDQVEIQSIGNGSQLSVGDSFTISINSKNSDVIPTAMDIQIDNIDSVSRETTDLEPVLFNVDLTELSEVELVIDKEFNDGLYILKIDVKDDEGSIKTDEIEFSVFSGELSKEVRGVLPSKGLYTNSKVILQTRISSSQVDPYLIWSHADEVIDQGYLSMGFDEIVWDSETFLGFNEIKLDVFPYKFSTITSSKSNIIFSTVVNDLVKDIFDKENYYKAHLFNGNYIDEEDKDLIIETSSEIVPKIIDDFYGLEFLQDKGFITNKSYIPHNEEVVLSHSIIINMLNLNDGDGTIFRDQYGSLLTDLSIADGDVRFTQTADEIEIVNIGLFKPEINTPNEIVITTIVKDESYELFFYKDGELLYRLEVDYLLEYQENDTDTLQIGANLDDGAEFLIDSFMVYINDVLPTKRNNIYSGVFKDFYGESVLGTGFNSIYVPENVTGEAFIDGEILTLLPGSSLDLGYYLIEQESYTLDVVNTESSKYVIEFFSAGYKLGLEVSSSINIKRRGDSIFIDVDKYTLDSNDIKLIALEELNIDNIIIHTREAVE